MIVLLSIYGLIFLIELFLIISFWLRFKSFIPNEEGHSKVSILVCARNEEHKLPGILDSLLASQYDMSKVEILVGNDNSTDNTALVVQKYSKQKPIIRPIEIEHEKDGLIAKGNVLAQLVDQAKFEKVLIIDADMKVEVKWLSTMVELLDNYDLISGFTIIDKKSDRVGDQSFDWAVVLHTMKAMSDAIQPISILGNNMGFTKSAYNKVDGFRGLGPTDVEDLGLLRRFQKEKLKIFQYMGAEGLAYSKAQKGFNSVLTQRVRWMNGVFTHHWLLALPAFFARLWFLIGVVAIIYSEWAALILILGFVLNYTKYIQVTIKSKSFSKFGIFTPASISLLDTFALLYRIFLGKVSWKGRKF